MPPKNSYLLVTGVQTCALPICHEADKRDAKSCTRENRRGTPRGASGFAAARSLTTAERGGEPPPGTARYSRHERRLPFTI